MTLKEKSKAPAFELNDQDGKSHALADYRGKKVILYFYPKDDTPGCTKEACNFRDDYAKFKKKDVIILGVSCDAEKSHKKFADKFSLPFPLLADVDKRVVTAYDVWKEKSFMGKKYMGIERTTFLIDEKGTIIKIFPKVNPEEHSAELLSAL